MGENHIIDFLNFRTYFTKYPVHIDDIFSKEKNKGAIESLIDFEKGATTVLRNNYQNLERTLKEKGLDFVGGHLSRFGCFMNRFSTVSKKFSFSKSINYFIRKNFTERESYLAAVKVYNELK